MPGLFTVQACGGLHDVIAVFLVVSWCSLGWNLSLDKVTGFFGLFKGK